jgi:tetratricopeptide (TPR) repeat protein
VRPARPFRELLQEALAAAKEGRTDRFGHAFREEAERHARLDPRGEDPVARALALGRQALRHLARGEREDACEKLSQALELHPSLGGGLALDLAEALFGESDFRHLRERLAPRGEVPPELPLLALLDRLPPEFWVEVLRGVPRTRSSTRKGQAEAEAPPRIRESPPRRPRPSVPRPRIPFTYRPLRREGSQGEKQVRTFLLQTSREPPEPTELRRWVAPGLGLEVREAGRRLNLRVLPEFRKAYPQAALLVLEAGRARVLVPLLPAAGSLPLPVDLKGGADLVAEVWSWEDLTPETLAELLREWRFYPDLLEIWLLYGMGQGLIPLEVVAEALRRLERGS